jgi:hypothetical protein
MGIAIAGEKMEIGMGMGMGMEMGIGMARAREGMGVEMGVGMEMEELEEVPNNHSLLLDCRILFSFILI